MKFIHELLDYYCLHGLHKSKSKESHFYVNSEPISKNNLEEFYPKPEVPEIVLEKENEIDGYQEGRFLYKSEIENGESNKNASGKYFIKEGNKVNYIVVHGWRMDSLDMISGIFTKPFLAENSNIFYYTLPYHFEREPAESDFSGELMVGANIERSLLSIKQAVTDLRALIYWLKKYNGGKVILIGVSLGGLVTNLVGVVENEMDALISLIYANSLAYNVFKTNPGKFIKIDYENNNFSYEQLIKYWEIITPSNFTTKIDKEKILLMSGKYDKYVHIEDIDRTWEAWGRPQRLRYNCGHSGIIVNKKKILKEIKNFVIKSKRSR